MHWQWGLAGLHADPLAAVMWYSSVSGLVGGSLYLVYDNWRKRRTIHTEDETLATVAVEPNTTTTYTEL